MHGLTTLAPEPALVNTAATGRRCAPGAPVRGPVATMTASLATGAAPALPLPSTGAAPALFRPDGRRGPAVIRR
ncbi:hypothetical protein ACFC09_04685 [Streptomyces sp. NPDC056161]|uniref:hypothetical protein n=1 Tax=Streptomyces sp. NPDC056161 TaxID=3345732 RepID=UPI0035D79349